MFCLPARAHRIGLAALPLAWLLGLPVFAAEKTAGGQLPAARPSVAFPRSHDQLWLISSRNVVGGASASGTARLCYWRLEPGRGWLPASLAEFLAGADPATPTCVYVHGNRRTFSQSTEFGWRAYTAFIHQAPNSAPVRWVIWSWPSDRIFGPLRDVRFKETHCGPNSFYLAWVLNQVHPAVRVSLVGFSYGARIATGSLHLLGGGQLHGRRLPPAVAPRQFPFRAVLIAAALDNDWILPGRAHGMALSQVDRMLLVTNECDRVLRRYRLLYHRHSNARALGHTGPVGLNQLGNDRYKLQQINACQIVGNQHDFNPYFNSPSLLACMAPVALFQDPPPLASRPSGVTPPAVAKRVANAR